MSVPRDLDGARVWLADHRASGHVPAYLAAITDAVRAHGGSPGLVGPAQLVARLADRVDATEEIDDPWVGRGWRRERARHRFVRQARSTARMHGADLLHWTQLDNFVVPVAWSTRPARPEVATLHRTYFVPPAVGGRWGPYRRTVVRAAFEVVRRRGTVFVHDAHSVAALGGASVRLLPFPVDVAGWPSGTERAARRSAQRAAWGVADDAQVLLAFGATRRDKGLPIAVGALAHLEPRTVLVIAGAPRAYGPDDVRAWTEAGPALRGRVVARFGHVPDAEVGDAFAAADVVVLPYDGSFAGSSGPGAQAAAYGVAIAASALPELEAGLTPFGLGRFAVPGDARDFARAVRDALAVPPPAAATAAFRAAHAPRAFGVDLVAAYRGALEPRGGRSA